MPNRHDGVPPISPIELLLRQGYAEAAIVLGEACPAALAPATPTPTTGDHPVDLAILAPSKAEQRDRIWNMQAAERAARLLAPGGIAYVVPATASRLRRELEARGLHQSALLLHVPDITRSRHILPIGTSAARYGLSGHVVTSRSKRLVAATLLRTPALATLGPTGVVFQRGRSTTLASWLFDLNPVRMAGSALISTRGGPSGGALLFRFPADEPLPDAVAKVGPHALQEFEALRVVGPSASRAGARVPSVLAAATLGASPVILQTALRGQVAARLLESRRLAPSILQERVASWLARWGRLSMQRRPLGQPELQRLVLSPAARLLPDARAYLAYLEELCASATGMACPFVASHGDLTSANILVEERAEIGIVDWEAASAAALPLVDFVYAAADSVAAVERYANRLGSLIACFAAHGDHTAHVHALTRRLAESLGVTPSLREICFHACWLHHAGNEQVSAGANVPGPFTTILRTVAAEPERFALTRNP
jgi:hypothetical protein